MKTHRYKMRKDWKQFAEWIGVPYQEPFECEGVENATYIVENNGVYLCTGGISINDMTALKQLINGTLTVKWVPKYKENYYHPSFSTKNLYHTNWWTGSRHDKQIAQNVGLYKTPEEAIAKAIELGWRELEEVE